jgi:hypothetical protein
MFLQVLVQSPDFIGGHSTPEHTLIYLHLSPKHPAIVKQLHSLELSSLDHGGNVITRYFRMTFFSLRVTLAVRF